MKNKEVYQLLEGFRTDQTPKTTFPVESKKTRKFTPLEIVGCILSISMIVYGGYNLLPSPQMISAVESKQKQVWEVDQVKPVQQEVLLASNQKSPYRNPIISNLNSSKTDDISSLVLEPEEKIDTVDAVALLDTQNRSDSTLESILSLAPEHKKTSKIQKSAHDRLFKKPSKKRNINYVAQKYKKRKTASPKPKFNQFKKSNKVVAIKPKTKPKKTVAIKVKTVKKPTKKVAISTKTSKKVTTDPKTKKKVTIKTKVTLKRTSK